MKALKEVAMDVVRFYYLGIPAPLEEFFCSGTVSEFNHVVETLGWNIKAMENIARLEYLPGQQGAKLVVV